MYSNMLVNCTSCRRALQLPPGAESIRCVPCGAITHVAYPFALSSAHAPLPPSPYNHAPPGPPPYPHGPKRAVIVGISYWNSRYELKGSVYYAKCMRTLLINKFSFPASSIVMLTDAKEEDPQGPPTFPPIRGNIEWAMRWLVQGCQRGDSLVFYFIGQGSQQENLTGDEVDGNDETLLPLDFGTNGVIVDDDINAMLVRPLPSGARLHAIIDASHSGTILDLPFLCKMKRNGGHEWEDHRPRSGMWKGSSGGEVICFSGCDDDGTYDNTAVPSKMKSTGAMTICFILAAEQGLGATYGDIFAIIRAAIANAAKSDSTVGDNVKLFLTILGVILTGGTDAGAFGSALAILGSVPSPFISKLWDSSMGKFLGRRQKPQLTASEPFDLYGKPFWI